MSIARAPVWMAAAGLVLAAQADVTVKLKPLPSGAMKRIGYYSPASITLVAEKPATLKKLPDGLSAPLFGTLPIGETLDGGSSRIYHVVLDEPDDKDARLFVDTNANGDLTDDPPAEWAGKASPGGDSQTLKQYSGGADVLLPLGSEPLKAHLGMYRFDKNDPARAALKDKLLYYRDYAMEGEVELGGKTYLAILSDERAGGDFRGAAVKDGEDKPSGVVLLLDINGDKKFIRAEQFDVRAPFNIDGTTYEIKDLTAGGAEFKIAKSSKQVEAVKVPPPPPDHQVGKKITAFKATTMDGKKISFPDDYKGKLVMLDFWATWCGPCMMEVPGLVQTYEKFHEKGFEVLGITLDKSGQSDKVKEVLDKKKMSWQQIYDGKFWEAEIAQLYGVTGIPSAFLVDGDSGEILGTARDLRGEALPDTIEKSIARKFGDHKNNGDKPANAP